VFLSGKGAFVFISARVAVCMSGSPRDASESRIPYPPILDTQYDPHTAHIDGWPDAEHIFLLLPEHVRMKFQHYVKHKKPTVVDTLHQYAYPAFGDFDIFMAVNQLVSKDVNSVCNPYVPKTKSNMMYCKFTPDYNPTSEDFGWKDGDSDENKVILTKIKNSFAPQGRFVNFAMQLWDYQVCDDMIREHERNSSTEYDFIIRMRPDLVFFAPINMNTVRNKTTSNEKNDECQIFIRGTGGGGEDIFNVGRGKVMHDFMQRFKKFHNLAGTLSTFKVWVAEGYATLWLEEICKGSFTAVGVEQWPVHPWRFMQQKEENNIALDESTQIDDNAKTMKEVVYSIFFIGVISLMVYIAWIKIRPANKINFEYRKVETSIELF